MLNKVSTQYGHIYSQSLKNNSNIANNKKKRGFRHSIDTGTMGHTHHGHSHGHGHGHGHGHIGHSHSKAEDLRNVSSTVISVNNKHQQSMNVMHHPNKLSMFDLKENHSSIASKRASQQTASKFDNYTLMSQKTYSKPEEESKMRDYL